MSSIAFFFFGAAAAGLEVSPPPSPAFSGPAEGGRCCCAEGAGELPAAEGARGEGGAAAWDAATALAAAAPREGPAAAGALRLCFFWGVLLKVREREEVERESRSSFFFRLLLSRLPREPFHRIAMRCVGALLAAFTALSLAQFVKNIYGSRLAQK